MEITNQVSNRFLSHTLKELGVKQESFFYWGNTIGQKDQTCWHIYEKDDDGSMEYISAFTVAELMEKLPAGFFLRKHGDEWATVGLGVPWTKHNGGSDEPLEAIARRIADAPAKMLIYLIENNLVDPHAIGKGE